MLDDRWTDITARVPFARPADLPETFSPFNIQLLGGRLYVAYAAVDSVRGRTATDVPGAGRRTCRRLRSRRPHRPGVRRRGPTRTRRGAWRLPRTASGRLAARCSSATSATARSRPSTRKRQFLDYLRDRTGAPISHRRDLGAGVRQRRQPRRRRLPVFHRGPEPRAGRHLRPSALRGAYALKRLRSGTTVTLVVQ